MIPKKAGTPTPHSIQRLALPQFRARLVFSRDDASGARITHAVPARILIVEDDFLIASDIESALSDAGLEIVGVANSADQALQIANAEHPALAVMDIRLNGKRDGVDAALELFETYGIRCVFASAHADESTRARAQSARPLAWVPKPYSMSSLVEAVRNALDELHSERT